MKEIRIGDICIGGDNPIAIQSMSNIDTKEIKRVLYQIDELAEAGCQIMRLAVNDLEAAMAFGEIKKHSKLPLVADIHFDYRLAIEAIKNGADKIRINPGNIGSIENVKKVVNMAKEYNVPIRVGVNSGSLQKDILVKYEKVTADALVESAIKNVELIENMNFEDIVISLKSSNVKMNYDAYVKIAKQTNYPLHIGVTEAGTVERGKIKSSVGIGALLLQGIGDTFRVSLTGNPINEITTAKAILAAAGLYEESIEIISCPTCGRTKVDLEKIIANLKKEIAPLVKKREQNNMKPIKLAIMGCSVNGPGEAKGADIGVACGDGKGVIFAKGDIIKTVKEDEITAELLKLIENYERHI